MPRIHADQLLVERGLANDLQQARALIMEGVVVANDHRVEKPGEQLRSDSEIRLKNEYLKRTYVSRGGFKLATAIDAFRLSVSQRVCLDLGASTGGFTDCLLQHGAKRVYAVDVGVGLLHWKLVKDPRVLRLEGTHARDLTRDLVPDPIEFLCADISFNALSRVIPPCLPLLAPRADLVLLVKPQFELAKEEVDSGGIVRDPELREKACQQVQAELEALGLHPQGLVPSAIQGTQGNQEFLLWMQN